MQMTCTETESLGSYAVFFWTAVEGSVIKVELEEATFAGAGNHSLKTDDGTYASDGTGDVRVPQIQKGAMPEETEIWYIWESSPEISATFSVSPNLTTAMPAKIRIEAVQNGREGMLVYEKDVTLSGSSLSKIFTTSDKLKKLVDNTTYDLTWKLSLDGGNTFSSIDETANKLFVTMDTIELSIPTVKRLDWATGIAKGASSITAAAEKVRDKLVTIAGPMNWQGIDPWKFLDMGVKGDCVTLTDFITVFLDAVGVDAHSLQAFCSADGRSGFPPVSENTCKYPVSAEFEFQGQTFGATLMYTPDNYFEGFFVIFDPQLKAYTIAPSMGPFENQSYYYLEVLRAAVQHENGDQFWVWDGDQEVNGIPVFDGDEVPGQDHFSPPDIPQ